ncbi:MAG: ATP-binding protein [Candidatus Kapaibacterium sp.]
MALNSHIISDPEVRVSAVLPRLRILVVDDEQAMLDAISLFFEDLHEITCCTTGLRARQLFSTIDFDIVICDLRLENESGADLLTEFKSIRPECERILMTGYTGAMSIINAINEAGISYYLTKPLDLLQLRIMIDRVSDHIQLRYTHESLLHRLQEHNLHLERLVALRSSELSRANEALQELQSSRERVIRLSVHDLQNPLDNLDSVLVELDKIGESNPDVQELVGLAKGSSGLMRALVEDMLSIAILSRADLRMRKDVIDIATLLRACARSFTPIAEQKGIWINVDIPMTDITLVGDEIQLRKALDNLISNSIKFTSDKGAITLRAFRDERYLTIEVQDTGQGMTPEDINNAFREFARLSAKPTGGESSTGLGLFIVKRIVEFHGGGVSAYSEGLGRGTTISMVLPMTDEEVTAATS